MIIDGGVIILFAIILIGGFFIVRAVGQAAKAKTAPTAELAHAVRLLDRVTTTDDAITNLPKHLREDIDVFLSTYYKELNQ